MFAIVGTVPHDDFPLVCAPAQRSGDLLLLENHKVAVNRGTPALIATAIEVCRFFKAPAPFVYLIGDIGKGAGSRKLYAFLENTLNEQEFTSLTFHYVQPDVDWHNRVLFAVDAMEKRPVLIADAGFMYAAKMSGQSGAYDLFTPDIGELAFLADETAPHPFYTRGFIFHEAARTPEMIKTAYVHQNAARHLLVKGEEDIVATDEGITATISEPRVPSLEAIGGTGDILTGLVAAFTGMGKDVSTACILAARVSRMAGAAAAPDPGTQVMEIIKYLPRVLEAYFTDHLF